MITSFIIVMVMVNVLGYTYYNNKIKAHGEKAYAEYQVDQIEKKEQLELDKQRKISAINELKNSINLKGLDNIKVSSSNSNIFETLNNGKKATIVFLGDSTTEKNAYTNGKLGHVELIQKQLTEIYGSDITVINAGISGHTIENMKDRLDNSVIKFDPDLVVINSGINDVGHNVASELFESTYREVIESIQENTDAKIILRTSSLTMGKETNDALEKMVNPIVDSLAKEFDLGYVDVYSYYQNIVNQDAAGIEKYNYNYSHPNEIGQAVIADSVLYSILLDLQ